MSHDRPCDRVDSMMHDVARTVSNNIQQDLMRHPEDALTILNAMNGNSSMPQEFTSSSQLLGNGISDGMMRDVARTVSADIQRDLQQHPEDALTILNYLQGGESNGGPINYPESNYGPSSWSQYNGNGRTSYDYNTGGPPDTAWNPFEQLSSLPKPPDPRDFFSQFPAPPDPRDFFEPIANTASDIVHNILPGHDSGNDKKNDDDDGGGFWDTAGKVAKTVLPLLSFL